MSSLEVATLLKDLDADVTIRVNAAERKARLKEVIGVGERASVVQSEGVKEMANGVDGGEGKGKADAEEKKKKAAVKLPGKATAPPPGKVLPIGPKD